MTTSDKSILVNTFLETGGVRDNLSAGVRRARNSFRGFCLYA